MLGTKLTYKKINYISIYQQHLENDFFRQIPVTIASKILST